MKFRKRWRVKIGDIGNALMVLIQLGTVWILWLTYKNTVIPTRQKELLSEQLAQLEMTRSKTIIQINEMEKRLKGLVQQSSEQVTRVKKLQDDKRRLSAEVVAMSKEGAKATNAAREAHEILIGTKHQLILAQLDIFHDRALLEIYRPSFSDRVNQINGSAATGQKTIGSEIQAAREAWPVFDSASKEVGTHLANLKSPLFPNNLGPSLAKIFVTSMVGFSCKMPDFDELDKKYVQRLKVANESAEQDVDKQEAKVIAEGKSQGIRYVIDPKNHQASVSAQRSMNEIGVQYSLDMELFDLRSECFKSYNKQGEAILEKYINDVKNEN